MQAAQGYFACTKYLDQNAPALCWTASHATMHYHTQLTLLPAVAYPRLPAWQAMADTLGKDVATGLLLYDLCKQSNLVKEITIIQKNNTHSGARMGINQKVKIEKNQ